MADLIDRAALLIQFDERLDESHIQACTRQTGKTLWSGINTGINWGRNTVIEAPAVDAVEVVRCKDCRKRDTEECTMEYKYEEYPWKATKDNDFCSSGERRTDATD